MILSYIIIIHWFWYTYRCWYTWNLSQCKTSISWNQISR